ncbi:MAG: UDP-N-acetylglucosamine 2-epimerase [Deltaproteobacteria bacterium]
MIHVAIGTKAQFIKMAPIIKELDVLGLDYNLIDLGQHSLISADLIKEFDLRAPDVYLAKGSNISRIGQGLVWIFGLVVRGLNKTKLKKEAFKNRDGVCLIHGDTVSTLLALFLAKRAGIKVVHVEAGLRSYNIFEPFPEEIVRLIAMRFSDILFAPSVWAKDNLFKMGYSEKTVLISANTSLESALFSLKQSGLPESKLPDKYALVTIHRMENVFSRRKMTLVVEFIEKMSDDLPVVFVLHQPTINAVAKFGLKQRLDNVKGINFFEILSHQYFIHLLNRSEFIITDGGSIQEESYYLNKPCLLLRKRTERMEGIGGNVIISEFKLDAMMDFFRRYKDFKNKDVGLLNFKPSKEIIEYLMQKENVLVKL